MRYKFKILVKIKILILTMMLFFVTSFSLFGARIKDIAKIEGVNSVQVVGYGLVSGLNNTGDNQQSTFTVQSVVNLLKRFGLTVPQTNPRIRNVAAVMVTANVPSFLRPGSKVDVQVSSIGDATTLQGGVLIMTPLSTADGKIIGMAQGAVSVGGYNYTSLGSRSGRNFVTTGRVPNGLILDKEIKGKFINGQIINIVLNEPDFNTAASVSQTINNIKGLKNAAVPINSAVIQVTFPGGEPAQIINYISQIDTLQVDVNPIAKVVINERTGTIVIGGNVQLLPSVVSHGGLEIQIQRQLIVPQPAPFTIRPPSIGQTANIKVTQDSTNLPVKPLITAGASVQDVANALNALKVKPRDLIAIFQALKEAGVLQGQLIIQ